jgi:cytochrome c oxidase subunit 1
MSSDSLAMDDHHDHKPGFFTRWFFSTNHKDIGTLYLIYAIVAGVVGGALSVIMRMELSEPGMQFVADGQMWNVIISSWITNDLFCRNACIDRGLWKLVYSINDWRT